MNRYAITLGDPGGIGTEVALKAVARNEFSKVPFLLIGNLENSKSLLKKYHINYALASTINNKNEKIIFYDVPISKGKIIQGKVCKANGQVAIDSLGKAVDFIYKGDCCGLITAPLNKKSINLCGYDFQGHTEYLQERDKKERVVMLLAGGGLKVALITRHIPYKSVTLELNSKEIIKVTQIVDDSLKKYWNIKKPHIGILGLNPHASDGGMFGNEEEKIISPAIKKLKKLGLNVSGPYAPDSAFHFAIKDEWGAVICMYHDQGLIPLKTLAFDEGVNITLGLSYVRTSPDHGTAFDIAGKGIASDNSMAAAIRQAIKMVSSALVTAKQS